MLKMCFYSCLILSHFSMQQIRYLRPWNKIVGTIGKMMEDIKYIHYIMFDQFEEIECLNECVEQDDIRSIISQFMCSKLPTCDDIKEFQTWMYDGHGGVCVVVN